jgi:hypothetical protein
LGDCEGIFQKILWFDGLGLADSMLFKHKPHLSDSPLHHLFNKIKFPDIDFSADPNPQKGIPYSDGIEFLLDPLNFQYNFRDGLDFLMFMGMFVSVEAVGDIVDVELHHFLFGLYFITNKQE